ncbi:hypothetical protein [Crocinitomix algicola]|uniref:hypothetical protein n=1 Tax=Crocinitomix algicola TaxID=1740263 RepID=UPI0008329E1A|nr:hypothetical protein [Crocinitomix algicola]
MELKLLTFCIFFLFLQGCEIINENDVASTKSTKDIPFEIDQYHKPEFNEKILQFLEDELETEFNKNKRFTAIFIHAEKCVPCINSKSTNLVDYFNHVNNQSVYFFINDTTFANSSVNNHIKFIHHNPNYYKDRGVHHNSVHLYEIINNLIVDDYAINETYVQENLLNPIKKHSPEMESAF